MHKINLAGGGIMLNLHNRLDPPEDGGSELETQYIFSEEISMKKTVLLLVTILISVTLLAVTANAAVRMSVYSTSLSLLNYYTGPTRSYTGSSSSEDMHWQGTTHASNQTPSMSTTFTIYLYRERKWQTDQLIGQVTCSREGYHDITWPYVGAGNYYFCYSKSDDGATVYSTDVILSMS